VRLSGLSIEQTNEIVPQNTILLGYVGSIAHGTYVPNTNPDSIDDKDIMGICIASENVYLGLENFEQKVVKQGEWDSVVYEIKKFFRLLLKNNPNVLGLLWLEPHNYIHTSDVGKLIVTNRDIFVSKLAYHSFVGYSKAQLHKMNHFAFEGYMGEKRKRLVEKFGYDTKNAAHLIRLMRMCIEFLVDGQLKVFREDAQELKAIKTGEWTLEKVKEEANRLFVLAQEAFVRSSLPATPDYHKAEELLMSILKTELKLR
jgi:uncharacterized protein